MAETESILTTTIFFIVAGVILFIFFLSFLKYKEIEYTSSLNNLEYKRELNKFETIFTLTDKYSRNPLSETIISSFNNNGFYSTIYGKNKINISLKQQFDYLYGENNYFLKIKPKTNNLKVLFLYDGEKFMEEISKKENFPKIINNIISDFNLTSLEIQFKVYILGGNSSDICNNYVNIECIPLKKEDFYDGILPDPVKIKLPGKNYADRIYYSNDWGTFLAKVSEDNKGYSGYYSKKELIVLFTDVMSLGGSTNDFMASVAEDFYSPDYSSCKNKFDSCYLNSVSDYQTQYQICIDNYWDSNNPHSSHFKQCVTDINNIFNKSYHICLNKRNDCINLIAQKNQDLAYGGYFYSYYCPLNNNFSISDFSVNRSIKILVNNSHYVFPIIVRNNNITETDEERVLIEAYLSNKSISLGGELYGGNSTTLCGKQGCEGCFENQTHSIFHNETRANHIAQVNLVSNKTKGKTIFYNSSSSIYDTLNNIIQDILSRDNIILGKKRETNMKHIFSKKLLANMKNEVVTLDIYLEVYSDNNYRFNQTLDFIPIINNYYNTSSNFYLTLSHNSELKNISISSEIGTLSLIETIPDLLYKYNITFNNPSILDISNVLTYKDNFGLHNLTIN